MSGVYSRFGPSLSRLLARFGQDMTFNRAVDGEYDPSTRSSVKGVPVVLTGRGAVTMFTKEDISVYNIVSTDKKLIYKGDELQEGDTFGDFRVSKVHLVMPDDSGVVGQICSVRS